MEQVVHKGLLRVEGTGACLVCPDPRIQGSGQTSGQTPPVTACWDCLQCQSLVVNNGGFFITGPAVIEIFTDKRHMFRCFFLPLRGSRLLFPQPEMAEDALYHLRVVDDAYDFHLMATARTRERVDFPYFLYELSPDF